MLDNVRARPPVENTPNDRRNPLGGQKNGGRQHVTIMTYTRRLRVHRGTGSVVGVMLASAALVAAGCGDTGSPASAPSSRLAASSEPSSVVSTTDATPTVDPAVVQWKKRWRAKIGTPMRKAVTVMLANAVAAANGDAGASFRLTSAFNKLSNCRNPLDFPPLSEPPAVLKHARAATLAACRAFYVGTNDVIKGLNAASGAAVASGLNRIRHGAKLLKRAAAAVKAAPKTEQ